MGKGMSKSLHPARYGLNKRQTRHILDCIDVSLLLPKEGLNRAFDTNKRSLHHIHRGVYRRLYIYI